MKTIIGNWKMEVGTRESIALARGSLLAVRGKKTIPELVVCPPFVALSEVRKVVARSHVALGAQNMNAEEKGAFTGEISARMLTEHGVTHVLIGHSERRRLFGETNETVNKKIQTALAHGLIPVVCVGESKTDRDGGRQIQVVAEQIRAAFSGISLRAKDRVYIAYEPVWAIGTGSAALPSDAVDMHMQIRAIAKELFHGMQNGQIQILYGGSVDDQNAYRFLRESEVDGLLVGGASVKLSQFAKIVADACDVLEGLQSSV